MKEKSGEATLEWNMKLTGDTQTEIPVFSMTWYRQYDANNKMLLKTVSFRWNF